MPQICGRPAADLPHTKSLRQGVSRRKYATERELVADLLHTSMLQEQAAADLPQKGEYKKSLRQGNQRK